MNQLMNLMNLMYLFRVHYGFSKKNRVIFFINGYQMWKMDSLKFIRFINFAMRRKKREIVRQVAHTNNYLMNLMNVCVVRKFNGFFEKVALDFSEFMKWLCTETSCRFIKCDAAR